MTAIAHIASSLKPDLIFAAYRQKKTLTTPKTSLSQGIKKPPLTVFFLVTYGVFAVKKPKWPRYKNANKKIIKNDIAKIKTVENEKK